MADEMNWLLRNLIEQVPGTRSAVLLAVDGIKTSWHGLNESDADRTAALASSLCGTARQFGAVFGDGTGIRQVVAEVGNVVAFVTAASENTVLAVIADPDVEARLLSHEMHHLCGQVRSRLATPTRTVLPGVGARPA
jgi:predicted regulator of Ras-like GTPase activity (Roadblock/LC7/MglB family)